MYHNAFPVRPILAPMHISQVKFFRGNSANTQNLPPLKSQPFHRQDGSKISEYCSYFSSNAALIPQLIPKLGEKSWIAASSLSLPELRELSSRLVNVSHKRQEQHNAEFSTFPLYFQNQKPTLANYGEVQVDKKNKKIHIGFRGTVAIDDLYYNLALGQSRDDEMQCSAHAGFSRLATQIYPMISQILQHAGPIDHYEVRVFGHSLGK